MITFFVCWAPFHAQRLLFLYARDWKHFNTVNTWLFSVAGWLYYVSCTINPILYNVMSHRYRVAFRETLCGRRRGFGPGFTRDQSSFRETTMDVGSESSKLLRVRSIMQSTKRLRYKGTLNATNNSVHYDSNCIRRSSLQIGTPPDSRSPQSPPNMTTGMVVMLENNLSGRPRCYTTTSATTVLSSPPTTTLTTAGTTETNGSKAPPLIRINGCLANVDSVNNVNNNNNNNCSSISSNINGEISSPRCESSPPPTETPSLSRGELNHTSKQQDQSPDAAEDADAATEWKLHCDRHNGNQSNQQSSNQQFITAQDSDTQPDSRS